MPFGISAGTASLIGAGVSAGGGILSGILGSSNTAKASAAAQNALAQQRADLSPYVSTGTQANTAAANLLGLNGQDAANTAMSNFQTSPGYQWDLSQGLRGVDAGAAAKGMLRSGATLKAEDTYSTGLADNEFSNYYNRLAGLSTTGENAASAGSSTAQASASDYLNSANAQNSIYGNMTSGVGNTVNNLLNNSSFLSMINGSGSGNLGNWVSNASSSGINWGGA